MKTSNLQKITSFFRLVSNEVIIAFDDGDLSGSDDDRDESDNSNDSDNEAEEDIVAPLEPLILKIPRILMQKYAKM